MKKKIIFSSYDDINNPYYAGGGAYVIHEIAKRLSKDFDITVITHTYTGAKDGIVNNVLYKRIGLSFFGPKLSQLFFHALLPFYVKKEPCDLWVESFTPPFSTSCLQLFTKKPVIGLAHMLAAEDMKRKYKLPFHLLENQGLKTYKYFITLTDIFKNKIERVNKNAKIFVIPNGVSSPRMRGSRSAKRKELDSWFAARNDKMKNSYLLYLGRIELDQKGLDLLIAACKGLKTNTRLVIAGSGLPQDERALKKLIEQSGLKNKVTLTGRVDGKKKHDLLRNCSLVVIPSRFETFGNVALEAIAYGKPLVHFAIEGLGWVPRDCSIPVKPLNIGGLSDAIEKVLTDKKLRQKMISASQRAIRHYSWEPVVKQYKRAIDAAIKEHE